MIQRARRAERGTPQGVEAALGAVRIRRALPPCHSDAAIPRQPGLSLPMELPVIGGRHRPTAEALIRAVRKAQLDLWRPAAEREESIDGALLLARPTCRREPWANAAFEVHQPAGRDAGAVLDEIDATFLAWGGSCRLLAPTEERLDDSWTPAIAARRYVAVERRVFLLEHEAPAAREQPAEFQAIPARALLEHYQRFVERDEARRNGAHEARETAACEVTHFDADGYEAIVLRRAGEIIASVAVQTVGEFGVLGPVRGPEDEASARPIEAILWHLMDLCRRCQFRRVIASPRPADRLGQSVCARLGMGEVGRIVEYVRPAEGASE